MKDPILYRQLLKEVDEKRVTMSAGGDLRIFKYTQDTHIEGKWNDVNRQARGLIMRTDGTIVARPFAKFFNLGEVSETKLDNLPWEQGIEVFEKLDGSCGIGFLDNDVWKLATPGSLSSDQAISGTCMLYNAPGYNLSALPTDCTPVFEIVYPDNRIVCDYTKDPRGSQFLALLAIIEHGGKEWHQARVDQIAAKGGFPRPKRYSLDLRSSDIPFNDNEEGYVALFEGGLRVKIKSPAYLRVHRLLNYLSPKGVIELMRGKEYGVTLRELPPSIARDFDDMRAYIQQAYDVLKNDADIQLHHLRLAVPNGTRKDQALWIQANTKPALRGLVFALLDAKDIEDGLWRLVLKGLDDGKQDGLLSRPNLGSDIR
jgi:RNA ligase